MARQGWVAWRHCIVVQFGRMRDITFSPSETWERVAAEPETMTSLCCTHVLPLGMIPVLGNLVGIGLMAPAIEVAPQLTADEVARASVTTAVFSLLIPFLLAALIRLLAPLFGARPDLGAAFRIAAYALTPVWLSGVLLISPAMFPAVMAVTLHSLFLLTRGLEVVLEAKSETSAEFTAFIVMGASVTLIPLGWLAASVGLI